MKFKLYSLLAAVAVATTMFFASCSEDKCKNVTCQNAGTCIDGACECASGYEGTNCETLWRTKFLYTWTMSGTDSDPGACQGVYSNIPVVISTPVGSTNNKQLKLDINGLFNLNATLVSDKKFVIESLVSGAYTYSGEGTINGNTLSLTLFNDFSGTNGDCANLEDHDFTINLTGTHP